MASISRFRGDTAVDSFTVKDEGGAARNVTAHTFLLTIDEKLNPTDSSTRVAQIPGTIIDAVGGAIEFQPEDGSFDFDIDPGSYYYDIQMTDPGGRVITLAKDEYIIVQDITK